MKLQPRIGLGIGLIYEAVKAVTGCSTVDELKEYIMQSVVTAAQGAFGNEFAKENVVVWDVVVSVTAFTASVMTESGSTSLGSDFMT